MLPLGVFALRVWARKRHKTQYADAHLWPWVNADFDVLTRPGQRNVYTYVYVWIKKILNPGVLWGAAWCCLVVALAGPRVALNHQPTHQPPRAGLDVVVALDLSHSMTADDVAPNRFLLAKSLIESLKNDLQSQAPALNSHANGSLNSPNAADRLGLVAFAGAPYVVSPLSVDAQLFAHTLNLLEPDLLPTQGSWLALALMESMQHLAQLKQTNQSVVVVFTDGAPAFWNDIPLPERFAQSPFASAVLGQEHGDEHGQDRAKTPPLPSVILVGVGTPRATPLKDFAFSAKPNAPMVVNGLLAQSRLEEASLTRMAQQLNGVYLHANNSDGFRQALLAQIMQAAQTARDAKSNSINSSTHSAQLTQFTQWQNLAWPFMALGALLMLVAFYGVLSWRWPVKPGSSQNLRGTHLGVAALSSVLTALSLAGGLSYSKVSYADLNTVTQADHLAQAQTAYQAGDYTAAFNAFAQIEDYVGWLGAGVSAYQNNDMTSAVAYFRQAALGAPTDAERAVALFNLGNSYYGATIWPWAIEAYEQALLYQPHYPKATHNLALALAAQEQAKQAQQAEQAKQAKAQTKPEDDQDDAGSGKGKGKGRSNESAFYGGQKPNPANDSGSEQGDGIDGGQSDGKVILPVLNQATHYQKNTASSDLINVNPLGQNQAGQNQTNAVNSVGTNVQAQALALIEQTKRQQRAQAFEQSLLGLKDEQKTLLKRLVERQEGFDAPQAHPHPIDGVQPW
ncbi:VWA domain-containing protein [Thiomicrorhabdus aquaedulcis]|uniref:VWA domain-containing protein n=1 Tax=Thiomicrorhabdus aquaedulcis TaxID=2211106 RepID=UPI0022B297A3|nr:VWA domain-containing protein [Thiomicrorhabdus aquaedulcis]